MKDEIKKYLAYDGMVSVICISSTEITEEIRKIHDLTPTTTAILGRLATGSALMAVTEMKEDNESYTIQINGKGPVGTIISVVKLKDKSPRIKTYIQNPHVELPIRDFDGKINVGAAIGNDGFFNVVYENELTDIRYSTMVELVSGEIAEDFAEFFVKSKQKPTAMALGVLVNSDGVVASGGYIIQPIPGTKEEVLEKLEKSISEADSISTLLEKETPLDKIAKIVTGDENIELLEEGIVAKYECNCKKENFEAGIISLGKKEIESIIKEDGNAEVVCRFCNKKYNFNKEDLIKMKEKSK